MVGDKMKKAQPIFIAGKNRSGTKWLTNIIANNNNVYAVQRQGAGGILESNTLTTVPKIFGSIQITEHYLAFLSFFLKSNFWKVLDIQKNIFYNKKFNDYYSFFRYLMDYKSNEINKDYWVQKIDSFYLNNIIESFPDAKIIIIRRSWKDNILSSLTLKKKNYGIKGLSEIIRQTFSYQMHKKLENSLKGQKNVEFITYEMLKQNPEKSVSRICDFLEVEYSSSMLDMKYLKNSSYNTRDERKQVNYPSLIILIRIFNTLFSLFPQVVYKWILNYLKSFTLLRSNTRRFILKTFSIYANELNID